MSSITMSGCPIQSVSSERQSTLLPFNGKGSRDTDASTRHGDLMLTTSKENKMDLNHRDFISEVKTGLKSNKSHINPTCSSRGSPFDIYFSYFLIDFLSFKSRLMASSGNLRRLVMVCHESRDPAVQHSECLIVCTRGPSGFHDHNLNASVSFCLQDHSRIPESFPPISPYENLSDIHPI